MSQLMHTTGVYSQTPLGYFFLSHMYEIMTPIFLTFIFLFILNFKTIKESFSRIKKSSWLILLVIFILGFWIRNTEYRYGVGLDGYIAQEMAKTIYEKKIYARGCAIGNLDSCRLYHQHLFPAGYPYLITLMFHLFGEHDILAMYISGILSSLTIILVFCITYLLFSDERKGLYAALIFALIPLDVFISSTGAVRPTSNFFIALTILFYLIALKKDSIKLWSLVAITFSYSIYVRQENAVLIIPLTIGLFLLGYFKKDQFKSLKDIKKITVSSLKKFFIPIILFLVTQISVQHWVLFGHVQFATDQPFFSFRYAKTLFPTIFRGMFLRSGYLLDYYYIPLVSLLFIVSIIFLTNKNYKNSLLFLWILFGIYFILITFFHQCPEFPEYFCLEYVRFLQHFHLFYAILAGFTLSFIERIRMNKNILFLVAFIFLILLSNIRFSFPIFKDGRMNESFIKEITQAVNKTPENSLVFVSQSIIPDFDLVRTKERRWIDIELIYYNFTLTEEEIKGSISINKPIVFIEDYLCRDYRYESCEFIRNNFDFTLLFDLEDIKIYNLTSIE